MLNTLTAFVNSEAQISTTPNFQGSSSTFKFQIYTRGVGEKTLILNIQDNSEVEAHEMKDYVFHQAQRVCDTFENKTFILEWV